MALNATFRNLPEPFGVELGLFTIMVGHATFASSSSTTTSSRA